LKDKVSFQGQRKAKNHETSCLLDSIKVSHIATVYENLSCL
jgi:hypothetical protein